MPASALGHHLTEALVVRHLPLNGHRPVGHPPRPSSAKGRGASRVQSTTPSDSGSPEATPSANGARTETRLGCPDLDRPSRAAAPSVPAPAAPPTSSWRRDNDPRLRGKATGSGIGNVPHVRVERPLLPRERGSGGPRHHLSPLSQTGGAGCFTAQSWGQDVPSELLADDHVAVRAADVCACRYQDDDLAAAPRQAERADRQTSTPRRRYSAVTSAFRLSYSSRHAGQPTRCACMPGTVASA